MIERRHARTRRLPSPSPPPDTRTREPSGCRGEGVDVELLGKLRKRVVVANCGQRDLRLERRGVVTSRPSAHSLLRFLGPSGPFSGADCPLIRLPTFLGPPLSASRSGNRSCGQLCFSPLVGRETRMPYEASRFDHALREILCCPRDASALVESSDATGDHPEHGVRCTHYGRF